MKDLIINDKWILDQISSESRTFSNWLSEVIDIAEQVMDEQDQLKVRDDIKKARKELEDAKKAISSLTGMSKVTFDWIGKKFNEESKSEGDLDFLTGKKKRLSSVLFDVSQERGIQSEGMLYLIKSLPDLEAFLYSTSVKKYYRDHTEHTLRVAVLGDYLLDQDFGQGKILNMISDLSTIKKDELKEKIWWATSLLHDIGYPLGKLATAVNFSLLNQILKCYPTLDIEFTPLQMGLSWNGEQEAYLDILVEGLTNEAKDLIKSGSGIYTKVSPITNPETFLKQHLGHPEFNFENRYELDHGVVSALCLLRSLGTPEELQKNDDLFGYCLAAKAIALHNFKDKLADHNFDNQPLAFFLMLIDELQEWGRPIPVQIGDTYFTTELKKISLLDEIILNPKESYWFMKFRNEEAKKLMNFDFKFFSEEKLGAFGRLERGARFSKTTIELQNIKPSESGKKKKEEIIKEVKIEI